MAVIDLEAAGAVPFPVSDRTTALADLPPLVRDLTTAERLARRTLDLTVAILGLLIMAIPMLVIALFVRLTSDGPSLFKQERVGAGGQPFRMVKFRTMVDGTDQALRLDAAQLKEYHDNDFKLAADDPRITSVGRFLRKTSLDELPQLFNVLRGEMSIVGIRPLPPEQFATRGAYDQGLYRHLTPGLTGRWQVEGRSSVQHEKRVLLDRGYVEHWSFSNDVRILLATPMALLRTDHTA